MSSTQKIVVGSSCPPRDLRPVPSRRWNMNSLGRVAIGVKFVSGTSKNHPNKHADGCKRQYNRVFRMSRVTKQQFLEAPFRKFYATGWPASSGVTAVAEHHLAIDTHRCPLFSDLTHRYTQSVGNSLSVGSVCFQTILDVADLDLVRRVSHRSRGVFKQSFLLLRIHHPKEIPRL